MSEALKVSPRESTGKQRNKRLRLSGSIPAVLYGHGQANVNLAVGRDEMSAVLRHHSRVVELQGAVSEKALIRNIQWDTYGIDLLHVDFTRVSEHERVEIQVPLELKGDAPGTREGGIVEMVVHEIEIECEAESIPEKIDVIVKELHVGGEIKAGDLPLPAGVTLVTDADLLLVHCVVPREMATELTGAGAEPELIGRKPGEEEGAGDE